MGMASSQVRLLAITNRMHDIEYKAQCLQNAKIRLAMDQDEAYQKYQAILDATTLTVTTSAGNVIAGTFDNLMANGDGLGIYTEFAFIDEYKDALVVPDEVYNAFINNPTGFPAELALALCGESDFDVMSEFDEGGTYAQIAKTGSPLSESSKIYNGKNGIIDKMINLLGNNGDDTIDSSKIHMAFDAWAKDGDNPDEDAEFKQLLDNYRSNPNDESKKIELLKALLGQIKDSEGNTRLGGFAAMRFDNPSDQEKWDKYVDQLTEAVVNAKMATLEDDSTFDKSQYNRYLTMFKMIKSYAGSDKSRVTAISDYNKESKSENAQSDSNWLQNQLKSGRFTVNIYNKKDGKFKGTSPATETSGQLNYTPETTLDKQKLAKAEAEYEHTLKQIDRKDKQYDTELSKLEAERKALDTEREGIKKVMEDNVDRTFGLFS